MRKFPRDYSEKGKNKLARELMEFSKSDIKTWLMRINIDPSIISSSNILQAWIMNVVNFVISRSLVDDFLNVAEKDINQYL